MFFSNNKAYMQKISAGDTKACRKFVDTHLPVVYRIAVRIIGDANVCDDIAQDVFIRVWKYAHTYSGDSSITTWLYRITHNVCMDYIKKKSAISGAGVADVADMDIPDKTDLADISVFKTQQSKAIQTALSQLTARERSAIILFYWEEQKIKKISDILGISESATESMIRRCRKKLAGILSEKDAEYV